MTQVEFNEKYKDYLEDGFYGLGFDYPEVTEYLDKLFPVIIKEYPDFKYQQIKLKFGEPVVYTSCTRLTNYLMEIVINAILKKE